MDNEAFSAMPLIYSQMEDKQEPIASSVKKNNKIKLKNLWFLCLPLLLSSLVFFILMIVSEQIQYLIF